LPVAELSMKCYFMFDDSSVSTQGTAFFAIDTLHIMNMNNRA
jgi:hypothetical protein